MKYLSKIKRLERGDTIVEVLISVSILALVLVASFASSSRSLHTGTDAANREQALSLAQQQIEIIKNDVSLGNLAKYTSQPAAQQLHFCVIANNTYDSSSSNCKLLNQYNISNSINSGLFTVNTTWAGGGNGQSRLAVNFRIPDPDSITQSVKPEVTLSTPNCNSPSGYGAGTACTLQWVVKNSTACTASGGWLGNKTASPNGTYQQTGIIFSGSDTTYTINCQNGGTLAPSSVTIHTNAPPVAVSISVSPSSINLGQSSTLTWTVSNATNCTASGSWNGSPNFNGGNQQVTPPSAGTYSYSINCTGLSTPGNATTNPGLTVNNPSPQITDFYASPSTIDYGGGTGLYWSSIYADNCYIPQFGWIGANSSIGTGALYGDTNYTLQCYSSAAGWSSPATRTVYVNSPPPPPDCSDRYVSVSAQPGPSWQAYVGGSNPCGVGISQCDVFTPYTTYEFDYGNSGYVDDSASIGDAVQVGCMDIGGWWGYADVGGGGGGGGGDCYPEDQDPFECIPPDSYDSWGRCWYFGGQYGCDW